MLCILALPLTFAGKTNLYAIRHTWFCSKRKEKKKKEQAMNIAIILENVCIKIEQWSTLVRILYFSLVHDLRQQLASLQNQLQKVQLERTTLTNKLKASETEITSLQNVRQWYQQQLVLAQEARVRLQSEMANIQVLCLLAHGRPEKMFFLC